MVIKRFTKIYAVLFILIFLLNSTAMASTPNYYVKNYNSFYNSLYNAISNKKPAITLYIYKYSSSKYPLANTILKAEGNNKNLRFIISSISLKSSKSGNYTKFSISFNYRNGDVIVNNLSEFQNAIYNAISSKRSNVKIIINNYSSIYNLNGLDKTKTENANLSSNIYRMPNSKKAIVDVNISYVEPHEVKEDALANTNVDLTVDEIKEKINRAIDNTEEKVVFEFNSPNQMDMEEISKKLDGIYDENPNSYYIKGFNIYQTTQTVGGVPVSRTIEVVFNYSDEINKIKEMKSQVLDEVNRIVTQIINNNMSERDKVKAIHDYIVNNTKYDYQNFLNDTIPHESYTAYGVLIKRVGVCQGYAHAMYLLLKEAGIENIIITGYGKGQPHAWNLVKVDGKYYHVDATFDDPIVNGGSIQTLKYDYFLITDSKISADHTWDTTKYPASN
ncbi:Transglutaminase-like superfamily protein [Caloramator mitchellensis]|uniref:Transglutaminase-like superfamily protein n=1 Tax=Caloramator mitchellensis TaxID=908809 RepID=A0A0R3JR83_CALMK|nr:transglutaminase domain-containing protein [Caloramator mitchellensis]KRQ85974.1 Transglutaminase-like superfamily protein [Caloramator mitchellensis]